MRDQNGSTPSTERLLEQADATDPVAVIVEPLAGTVSLQVGDITLRRTVLDLDR